MAGASSHTPQGCWFDPLSGCWGRQPMDVSFLISMFLPLSLSLSLFLSKLIKVSSGKDKKNHLWTHYKETQILQYLKKLNAQ